MSSVLSEKTSADVIAQYVAWIDAYEDRHNGFMRGRCAEAVSEMVAAFPELRAQPGHVECTWGRDAHHWCVTPLGEVVDPTRSQFVAIFSYDPFKEGDDVRIGRCMECGDGIWGQQGDAPTYRCKPCNGEPEGFEEEDS